LAGEVLDEFAKAISDYIRGERKPLVIELKSIAAAGAAGAAGAAAAAGGVASATAAAGDRPPQPGADARYVSTSRSNGNGAVTSRISSH
jgi:hypothetical protein